ncbi:MAG: hypothetical protein AAB522_02840 [Patescibacteria group bacterium]
MQYKNERTSLVIELDGLSEEEKAFLNGALARFQKNVHWGAFENFAFGPQSPIYARRRTFGQLTKDPLYLALQDMWLELGIKQGEVTNDLPKHPKITR